MKSQACASCAKRKVRCDREEPCSNCKRRRQECIFPEISPADRIRKLESLVRRLGGDPDEEDSEEQALQPIKTSPGMPMSASGSADARDAHQSPIIPLPGGEVRAPSGNDSIILQTGDQTVYLESFTYHSWGGNSEHASNLVDEGQKAFNRAPTLSVFGSDALQGIIASFETVHLASRLPEGRHADYLWNKFRQRVQPLYKLLFDWELEALQVEASDGSSQLKPSRLALLYALYLLSAVSLSEDECMSFLSRSRSALISDLQAGCEQALSQSEFLWTTDVVVLQALAIYLTAGLDRLSVRSLWSLMGLTIRNAERLGIHRDGTLFGIPPVETERRRRLWWQLQHLDVGVTIQAGAMPLTLMADWDAKLPLNIEDYDLRPNAEEFPRERDGLTSLSHCRFVFWIIHEQRTFRRDDGSRLGFTWTSDKSISRAKREAWLQQLESGINRQFLQYCEPIRPVDVLVQHVGRSFICTMRRVMLHSLVQTNGIRHDKAVWEELLDTCVQCLEYNIVLQTNPLIQHFRWRIKSYFQWSALVCLVLEAGKRRDMDRVRDLWDLLSRLYSTNQSLLTLQDDRRRFYAAELIVASWRAHDGRLCEKPAFVSALEAQLPGLRTSTAMPSHDDSPDRSRRKRKADWPAPSHPRPPPSRGSTSAEHMNGPSVHDYLAADQMVFTPSELDVITDLQFDEIDWTFWNSLS